MNNIQIQSFVSVTAETLESLRFPPGVTALSISYLGIEYLEQMSQISHWKEAASESRFWDAYDVHDLTQLLPKLKIIDQASWERHFDCKKIGIDFENGEVFNKCECVRVIRTLSDLVETDEDITLLTIPRGLSFNKLIKLIGPIPEKSMIINDSNNFRGNFGDIEVDKTYRVVITNNILRGSLCSILEGQKKLINDLGVGFALPKVIEKVSLVLLTFMDSGNLKVRLFNNVLSICQEKSKHFHYNMSFSTDGINITIFRLPDNYMGVVGRVKFSATKES